MPFKRAYLISLISLLLLTAAFVSGYAIRANQDAHLSRFPLLAEAFSVLANHGLKDLPPTPDLEYGMIRGMVQAYDDPYTIFVEPAQHELESDALHGSFGGIGVNLGTDPGGYVVLFPFPDSPASEAGILDGDRLLAVGEMQIVPNTPMDTIQSAIRGPVGKTVTLTIGHAPDFSPVEVAVKRAEIPLPSVTWHLSPAEPRAGVIEVNLIASSTSGEIQRAIQDLQDRGATHFVLDLRDNPGGLLTGGIDIARLFLRDGIVIDQQYRGRSVDTYRVEAPGPFTDIPLAVLVDHGSASAAEIIAGALKAHHRALIVGSPTYGKDTIQLVFDLSDGSSLHVTSAHWWIPGLEPPLGGNGVQPDILVETSGQDAKTSSKDAALQAAIQALFQPK